MAFPELRRLDRYRLRRNWTFQELSDAADIPLATLFYLLKRLPPGAHPTDRTREKIRSFLAKHANGRTNGRPRRRRVSA